MKPIVEIAESIGIDKDNLELFGKYVAKVDVDIYNTLKNKPNGKLILITSITPTPAGEGKTSTAIGLVNALARIGKKSFLCLREPSVGLFFGLKGAGTGGGKTTVEPANKINFFFTGDFYAVGVVHNLIAALIDNHICHGNILGINPAEIVWRRVTDVGDRSLRNIIIGLGGQTNGVLRETGFDITPSSEILTILSLVTNLRDLKNRIKNIVIGYTFDKKIVKIEELEIADSLVMLLSDAFKPNLVQTNEGQPAFVHLGPFANISHGNNSVIATQIALKLADYVVTESGFGVDLGAEKFFHIICRQPEVTFIPDLVVLVVTARALKIHGGIAKLEDAMKENLEALKLGFANLERHLSIIKKFGVPAIIVINHFESDSLQEIELIQSHCANLGYKAVVSKMYTEGSDGGIEVAEAIVEILRKSESKFRFLYPLEISIKEKIEFLATELYGASGVEYSSSAEKEIKRLNDLGLSNLPICMAKTHLSLTDNPKLKGAPTGWKLRINNIRPAAGAGFIISVAGETTFMPGLPKKISLITRTKK